MDKLLQSTINLGLIAFVLVLMVSVGCGDPGPPLGSLSGTVLDADGKGVECRIQLFDPVSRLSLGAKCDESGSYLRKDIPFGDYQFAVHQLVDPHSTAPTPIDERIPKKYRTFDTSEITISVQSEDEQIFNLEMK